MAKGKGRPNFQQTGHAQPPGLQTVAAKLQRAIALHQQGVLWQAEALYREILQAQPRNFDALHLLGIIEAQKSNFTAAVDLLGRAIRRNPASAAAHSNLGNALLDLNRPGDALASYDRALALKSDYPEAHANRGNALLALQRPAEALAGYERALALNPRYFNALFNRGNALGVLQRHEEALASYDQALSLNPGNTEALNNRGATLLDLRRYEEALASCDRALALQPAFAAALNSRGNALLKLSQPAQALASYERALALDADYLEAHANRGDALRELKRPGEALASYDLALARGTRQDHARAHGFDFASVMLNRGNVLRDLGRNDDALASFDAALSLKPDYAEALYNRGAVLSDLKRHDEAAGAYTRLLEIAPEHEYAAGRLLWVNLQCCDWTGCAQAVEHMVAAVAQGKRVDAPFAFLSVTHSAATQLQCARIYAGDKYPATPASRWRAARQPHERIRVAYVSADFREHPVTFLTAGLFEKHDRARFETIAIALRPAGQGEMGQRVQAAFERFVDVSEKSDGEAIAVMRELEVDIAVDLSGYTGDCRTAIFVGRCAPLQVNYLGFPATMGVEYMDYIIADEFVIPRESQVHYAEQVVYLPDTFQANDDRRRIGAAVPARQAVGLPDSGFVFCSFNNNYKINPATFDAWMRVLHAAPGSVLWMFAGTAQVQRNLQAEAARRGIAPSRLVFAQGLAYADHLARLRLADLFLDTLPFNAGTTASDALWAGIPVLTCAGHAFAARMAGSLLRAAGLPELIARDPDEYESMAIRLATDALLLPDLRARLARNRTTCPLFDTDRFRRHIESAYVTMSDRYQRGEPPAGFAVPPAP